MNTTLNVDPDVEALAMREKRQKIRYAKINIAEFLEGVKDLKIEEIGFYTLILFRMYDNMGALPDDDRRGAADMRCDIRVYRRIKALLIAKGKLEVGNGKLLNYRVAREIMEMKAELRRRSEAATEREAQRKGLGSGEQLAEPFDQPSGTANAELSRTSRQKPIKINGRHTTTVPQPCEKSAGIQNPESIVKKESESSQQSHSPELAGLNGAQALVLEDFSRWLGNDWAPDPVAGRRALNSQIALHGASIVKAAYAELKSQIDSGDLVNRPVVVLNKICERLKREAVAHGKGVRGQWRKTELTPEQQKAENLKKIAAITGGKP